MNSNFELLNQTKKTIFYVYKQLINFSKSEVVLKQNIEKNMYEMIEIIFCYSVNENDRIKNKYLKDFLVKLSMLDFYMMISYEKKQISKKKYESVSGFIIRIRKILYGLIRNDVAIVS